MSLPTWNDELYFEYHRGVYTTQANHKRNMRVAETQTLDAEKLASLAWLDGAPYPADVLTENWKKITFNQFHDLAAGSGIAVIYRDAQNDFTEVANPTQPQPHQTHRPSLRSPRGSTHCLRPRIASQSSSSTRCPGSVRTSEVSLTCLAEL